MIEMTVKGKFEFQLKNFKGNTVVRGTEKGALSASITVDIYQFFKKKSFWQPACIHQRKSMSIIIAPSQEKMVIIKITGETVMLLIKIRS